MDIVIPTEAVILTKAVGQPADIVAGVLVVTVLAGDAAALTRAVKI
jgi:hypothetical protein